MKTLESFNNHTGNRNACSFNSLGRLKLLRTDCGGRARTAGTKQSLKLILIPPTHCMLALTLPRRALMAYQDRNEDLACADHV